MKFFTILAIVGFASANISSSAPKWESDHEYVYSYKGRMLTGIPELAEKHFSGMGIHAKIHLQVLSENRMMLKIVEAEYARVNDVLESHSANQEGHNWRHINIPSYVTVPAETMKMLRQPSLFEVESTGRVRSVTVSREEPEWSVNFKKALIVLFQTQKNSASTLRSNSISQMESSKPIVNFWTVMEQSVDGECETRYEMNELPKSVIVDELMAGSESEVSPAGCPTNSRVIEIIKTRNVNNCIQRSTFSFSKPGGYECHPDSASAKTGNCAGMFSRSSITRYIACGSQYEYTIQKIVNEGELNQDLLGFKSEKMTTGTRQVLELISKTRKSVSEQKPESPITMDNLFYEYSVKKDQETLKRDLETNQSILSGLPTLEAGLKSGKKMVIKEEIKNLLKEIVSHDLFTHQGLPETQITMKALGLAKGFASMSVEEIESLYNTIKSEFSSEKHTVFQNIFIDTVVMSGTVPSTRFVMKMIRNGELSDMQTKSVFLSLTRSLITPTTPLLEELYELVISNKVKTERNVYNTAVLGFSTLIEKACLSSDRNTSYPTFVFGKFCHEESHIVISKWIPYLTRSLSESNSAEEKNVYIVALGLLSHKNIISPLYHVLENTNEESVSPLMRTLAVYSLTRVGREHRHHVLPILSAIYSNRAERTEVRVAAFNVLIKLNPDMYILQKIATLTWIETDSEILKLVNTAFYTLSESISMQDVKPETSSLIRKVRLLLPLIKKSNLAFPTTGSVFTNDFLKYLNVGFERLCSWTATKDSSLPTDFYSKISYFMDNYRYTPLEYGYHVRGSGSIIKELLDIVSGKVDSTHVESSEEQIISKLTGEWRKVVEKLNLKPRLESDRPEAAFFLNIFETSPIFKTFAIESSTILKSKVQSILRNPSSLLRSSEDHKISFQRMFNMAPTIVNIPSDMGLPISIEVHMPLVLSLQGELRPEELSLSKVALKSKVHAMATVSYTGWVGTICPFTGEYIVTGIDQHAVLNLPHEIEFSLNRHEQTMNLKMKAMEQRSAPMDMFHYHVRPFTTSKKVWDIKPLTKSSNFKVIKPLNYLPNEHSEPREESHEFLPSLGLGLSYNYLTTEPMNSRHSILPTLAQKWKMYNQNPLNIFRFFFVSTAVTPSKLPSIREHKLAIKYNSEHASTKEIELTFKYGFASKQSESDSIMYHTVEEHMSRDQVLPLMIKSQPISHFSKHPVRQQKIQKIMQENELKTGYGFSLSVIANLHGSSERSMSYTLLGSFGKAAEIKSKFALKLESDNHNQKICLLGDIEMPLSPAVYDINKIRSEENKVHFVTKLGYGNTCEEKTIKVTGHARTSEKQKQLSRTSVEAKEYQRLVENRVALAKLSPLAEKVRRQASVLDEVDFTVEYKRINSLAVVVAEKVLEYIKIANLPNLYTESHQSSYWSRLVSSSEPSEQMYEKLAASVTSTISSRLGHFESGKVDIKMIFQAERRTYSIILKNEQQEVKLIDLPVPFPLSYYFPISTSAVVSRLEASVYPICKIEGQHLSTYDNLTIPMHKFLSEECEQLISADCSSNGYEWSVLISKNEQDVSKVVKVFLKNVPIVLIPTSRDHVIVKVNGQEIPVSKNSQHIVKETDRKVLATIYRSNDDTITIKSRFVTVVYNGELLEVIPSILTKGKLCGVCGNQNGDKSDDLISPQQCLLSNPELLMAAYSIPKSSGRRTECIHSEKIREQLRKETVEKCLKVKVASGVFGVKTESQRSESRRSETQRYESQRYESRMPNSETTEWMYESNSSEDNYQPTSSCYKRSHHVFHRHGKTCVSNMPFSTCRTECKPVQQKTKEVSFHCMSSEEPQTKQILARVYRGETVPELMNKSRDVERTVTIPESCKPTYSNY